MGLADRGTQAAGGARRLDFSTNWRLGDLLAELLADIRTDATGLLQRFRRHGRRMRQRG
jgi:hypothetical protein